MNYECESAQSDEQIVQLVVVAIMNMALNIAEKFSSDAACSRTTE